MRRRARDGSTCRSGTRSNASSSLARIDPLTAEAFSAYWAQLGPETKGAIVDLLPDDWSFAGKRQREIENAEARLAAARHEGAEQFVAVRRSYEESLSWRLTRPLREAARRVRERRTG